jgi:hypothetical protein
MTARRVVGVDAQRLPALGDGLLRAVSAGDAPRQRPGDGVPVYLGLKSSRRVTNSG